VAASKPNLFIGLSLLIAILRMILT